MTPIERMAQSLLTTPGEVPRRVPGAARNLSRPTVRSDFGPAIVRMRDHARLSFVEISRLLGESRQAVRAAYLQVKQEENPS